MSAYDEPAELQRLYRMRFGDPIAEETRIRTWKVLCDYWFPRFIPPDATVVELGAGGCEFINSVKARHRIAIDLNPDVRYAVSEGVQFLETSAATMPDIESHSVDIVFSSNFFEHLGDAQTLLSVLRESHRILQPAGKLITLMPNLSALGAKYFDYLDHTLPLTEKSLAEALAMAGFTPTLTIKRFLPYTAAERKRPVNPKAVKAYLRLPLAWRVLGKQMFVVAEPTHG